MFPKVGNAFAQQKELERQKRSGAASQGRPPNPKPQSNLSSTSSGDTLLANIRDVPDTPLTTFDMFLPKTRDSQERSPTSQNVGLSATSRPTHAKLSHQRSATDPTSAASYQHRPALPQPLFTEQEGPSPLSRLVSSLNSKAKESAVSPAPPTLSGKALQVLGGEVTGNSATKSSIDLPKDRYKSRPDPYRISSGSSEDLEAISGFTPHRNTPNPTKRWLIENQKTEKIPLNVDEESETEVAQDVVSQNNGQSKSDLKNPEILVRGSPGTHSPHSRNTDGIILGNSTLSPTRLGTYGTANTVKVVDKERVASRAGSIVQPSPIASKHQENLALKSPSPMSARADPHDQPVYGEYRVRQDPLHPFLQNHMLPPAHYGGYLSPGPWVKMQRHHPTTMPVFTPNTSRFHSDYTSPQTNYSFHNYSSVEARSPEFDHKNFKPDQHRVGDTEATPKRPSSSRQALNGLGSGLTGTAQDPIQYLPNEPTTTSSNYSISSSQLRSEMVEQLIKREFEALRVFVRDELDRVHRRIDEISQTSQAFVDATKTLEISSASIGALSKGVQRDVEVLRNENFQIRKCLEREFGALQRENKSSEEGMIRQIEKSVLTIIQQHVQPLLLKLQQIEASVQSKKVSGDSNARGHPTKLPVASSNATGNTASRHSTENNALLDRPVNAPKAVSTNPMLSTFKNVNVSALGGAWLRQAESMDRNGGR